jgi:hypothetical protein
VELLHFQKGGAKARVQAKSKPPSASRLCDGRNDLGI